ncbi:GtrA family protein [Clostridium sp. SHJSY1]|uniref:GtrA family protein n=1 Tax=Clostridium sp. SHJSY1 TaxID=2942483 RepID=UPI002875255C|nr:GtrA family protein [Clostridium sp. SHJSY1]MDS0525973.1 GtrA family protein [Clostridium sp. SHJSY1]
MKIINRGIDYIFNGKLKQIIRFSFVGVMNTLVDFVMFSLFNGLLGVNYTFSQIIGYSSGVINSYIFNKKWTFSSKNRKQKTNIELIKFVIVNLCSLIITLVVMNMLISNFGVNVYLSKVIVMFIAQVVNFLSYKILVFN